MSTPPLPTALSLLADEPNPAADAAILEVLPDLEPGARSAALNILTDRAHLPTLGEVVTRFGDFDETLQQELIARLHGLFPAIRRALTEPSLNRRANAIEMLARAGSGRFAYLLADALRFPCGRTRELAAAALHRITADALTRRETCTSRVELAETQSSMNGLAEALRQAVMHWETHVQPVVLEAALWLSDQVEPAIRKKLQQKHTRIASAIASIVEGTSDPRLAGFALRALAIPELRVPAARTITQGRDRHFRRAVLAESWLLDDPHIEEGCRWIRMTRWNRGGASELAAMEGVDVTRGVRLLTAGGGSHEQKAEILRRLIDVDCPELRHAVLWHLVRDRSETSAELLTLVASRFGTELARIAARELRRRQIKAPKAAAESKMENGEPTSSPGRRAFERYWDELDNLDSQEISTLAEAMRPIAGDLLTEIREKLAGTQPLVRARALRIARMLGLLTELQEEIYALAHDADAVVRSLAVKVLAELPGPTSCRVLRAALNDPDNRVQANAVEALDRLDVAERVAGTEAKLDSPCGRVRANAVKSLLRLEVQKAGEVLVEMLGGASSDHRLSALWVVERLNLQSLIQRIQDINRNDPDVRVRRRAGRVLRHVQVRRGSRPAGSETEIHASANRGI